MMMAGISGCKNSDIIYENEIENYRKTLQFGLESK